MFQTLNVFAFLVVEVLLIFFSSLLIALRSPLDTIYGKDIQLIESVGIGMCVGFQWCAILTVFWTNLERKYGYLSNKYALFLLLTAAIGICLFTVLDYFYISRSGENPRLLYFSRGDMRLRVITAGFGLLVPTTVLGYLILGPVSASLCLVISIGVALPASYYVSDEYLDLDLKREGVQQGFIVICTAGSVLGSILGSAKSGVWGGILFAPLGIIGLAVALGAEFGLVWILFHVLSPLQKVLLTLIRFREIICNNCFRYTAPLKSEYRSGERHCEHCEDLVEHTKEVGKVIFSFGNYQVDTTGREFIFNNPVFSEIHEPRDVSEVYVDVDSTDPIEIERLVAQVRELFPPKKGLDSITIFHRGNLSDLGQPIVNLINNNFSHVLEA